MNQNSDMLVAVGVLIAVVLGIGLAVLVFGSPAIGLFLG
jgi:hypothetical protein